MGVSISSIFTIESANEELPNYFDNHELFVNEGVIYNEGIIGNRLRAESEDPIVIGESYDPVKGGGSVSFYNSLFFNAGDLHLSSENLDNTPTLHNEEGFLENLGQIILNHPGAKIINEMSFIDITQGGLA